jgi:hypothetical protein
MDTVTNKIKVRGFLKDEGGSSFKYAELGEHNGQFTGVYDVDGREIYEGDIVTPVNFNDIPNLVKFVSHGFYRVKMHGAKTYYNILGACNVRIIGNIYETPELIDWLKTKEV